MRKTCTYRKYDLWLAGWGNHKLWSVNHFVHYYYWQFLWAEEPVHAFYFKYFHTVYVYACECKLRVLHGELIQCAWHAGCYELVWCWVDRAGVTDVFVSWTPAALNNGGTFSCVPLLSAGPDRWSSDMWVDFAFVKQWNTIWELLLQPLRYIMSGAAPLKIDWWILLMSEHVCHCDLWLMGFSCLFLTYRHLSRVVVFAIL